MAGPIRATEIKPERVTWLAPDKLGERIPCGMMTIVGGKPDQGKGLFVSYVAAQVSRTQFVSRATGNKRPGRVLYSAIEDSHSLMTRPRLEAAGANLRRIDLWRFMMPAHLDSLFQLLEQNEYDLLVIDPLAAHLSHGVSRHSDNIREVLNPLSACIEETGTAVLVVEHVLKRTPPSSHPIAAIGGTGSGVVAAARMAYLFGVDPHDKDRRILAAVKNNIRDTPKALAFEIDVFEHDTIGDIPHLMLDQELDFAADRLLTHSTPGSNMGRPSDKRAAAAEWLSKHLWAEHKKGNLKVLVVKINEDAKQVMMNTKTLRRAAVDMGVIRSSGSRNTMTWELPPEILKRMKQAEDDPEGGPTEVPDEVKKDIRARARSGPKKTVPAKPKAAAKPKVDAKKPGGDDITDEELQAWLNGPPAAPIKATDAKPDEKEDKSDGSKAA